MTEPTPEIRLSVPELMLGATVGIMRQCQNLKLGRKQRFGCPEELGWHVHVEGALGEMAFAKYAGLYWSGNINNLDADDVAEFQVRTVSKDHLSLILHPSDNDEKLFFLVVGSNGTYRIVGGIKASLGKVKEYWKDPAGGRPAFFVPQGVLQPPWTFGIGVSHG